MITKDVSAETLEMEKKIANFMSLRNLMLIPSLILNPILNLILSLILSQILSLIPNQIRNLNLTEASTHG